MQSPALPLGHAAKKSNLKSRKEQVFIQIFLLKPLFFYLESNSTYFFQSFSKNLFLFFWILFRLVSSMDSILKHTLLTLKNFPFLFILLKWQRSKNGFPVTDCKIQNKLEPLTRIFFLNCSSKRLLSRYSLPPFLLMA